MQGNSYRLGIIVTLLFGCATSYGAVALRIEASTTPPGGIVALGVYLDSSDNAPTTLVIPLGFDRSVLSPVAIVADPEGEGATFDYGATETGAVLIAYVSTGSFEVGHLATLYLEVATDAPRDTSIVVSDAGVTASNRDAEGLNVTLSSATVHIATLSRTHSADTDGNGRISLSEVLRVVQLYNLETFRCDGASEDGFSSGTSPRECDTHDLDYAPQDWRFNLSEILRCVQFFNAFKGTYQSKDGTEDGFTAGLER